MQWRTVQTLNNSPKTTESVRRSCGDPLAGFKGSGKTGKGAMEKAGEGR